MRPGLVRAMSRGRPEEHRKSCIIPLNRVVTGAGEDRIKPGEAGVFQRTAGKTVVGPVGEENVPVGFGGDMPAGRT